MEEHARSTDPLDDDIEGLGHGRGGGGGGGAAPRTPTQRRPAALQHGTPGSAYSGASTPTTGGRPDSWRRPRNSDDSITRDEVAADSPTRTERRRRRKLSAYHRWEIKYGFRIIAYVNTKSGGKQGQQVLTRLRARLPAHQVHDLFQPFDGVEHTLPKHMADVDNERFDASVGEVKTIRILACGGDGTVGWVAASMEKLDLEYMPEVALLPLGTGNDLAKVLHWGRYFHKIETFHAKHFVKKVFTARSTRLDRWKLRVLTADVLDRDQLQMFVPPSLRRTHSLVGGSDAHSMLDKELMKVQLVKRQSLYRRNLAAAQRVAAQWFEDRELFERQQKTPGGEQDFRTWQDAHHNRPRGVARAGPESKTAGGGGGGGGGGDDDDDDDDDDDNAGDVVLDPLSSRAGGAAAAADSLVRCNIAGLPVHIDPQGRRLKTVEEILAEKRRSTKRSCGQLHQVAAAAAPAEVPPPSAGPRRTPAAAAEARRQAGKVSPGTSSSGGNDKGRTNGFGGGGGSGSGGDAAADGENIGSGPKYRRRRRRRPPRAAADVVSTPPTSPSPTTRKGLAGEPKPVTYERADSQDAVLMDASVCGEADSQHAPTQDGNGGGSGEDVIADERGDGDNHGDDGDDDGTSTDDGLDEEERRSGDAAPALPPVTARTPQRPQLPAAGGGGAAATAATAEVEAAEAEAGSRWSMGRVAFAPTLARATEEEKSGGSFSTPERGEHGSPPLVFTQTLTPTPRVSFSFGAERAHFSGLGITVDPDGKAAGPSDDVEYDLDYQRRLMVEAENELLEAAAVTTPAAFASRRKSAPAGSPGRSRSPLDTRGGTPASTGHGSGGGGGGGGGGAKVDPRHRKDDVTRRQTLEMQASHFRPWKTGTLLNYFHVGVGARLVYEFEAERRNAPERFKSRKANNCMYMSKWLRACCLTCKESLECDRDRRQSSASAATARAAATGGGGAGGSGRRQDIMEQSEFGFVESVNSKITLKVRPPPPLGSPPGTEMPFEELDWQGWELAEIAFVNIGSFGGGRIRTDEGHYNRRFARSGKEVELGDGVIEIIGFRSLTHICCAMGCNGHAIVLGQATEILMYVHRNDQLYMGVDGEPFKASGVDEQGIDFAIHLAPDMQIPMLRPR